MKTDKVKKERIAKVIAQSGLCSRRDAENWILAGRVALNGSLLLTPAVTVSPQDYVIVDGKELPQQSKTRLWLYHKPRGLITTHKDPEGRPAVFQYLPKGLPRIISVGRLDMNSEGLLLLTNDGGLSRFLEHPETRIARTYRVRVFGKIDARKLRLLRNGLTIDNVLYGAIEANLEEKQGANQWLTLTLYEGKNREIRKIMQYFGLAISRLVRISYGSFTLGSLAPEEVWEVPAQKLDDELLNLGYCKNLQRDV